MGKILEVSSTGQIVPSSRTASTTSTGLVELATNAETQAGTDTTRAVTPAGLAAWPRTGSVTVTVGPSGCDYTTLNGAISALCKRYPGHGARAVINVAVGFVLAEQVLVRGQNLGWITISGGSDLTTPRNVQTSAITEIFDGTFTGVRPVFGVCNGGTLPTIAVPFAMDATTAAEYVRGLAVLTGGSAVLFRGITGASTIAGGVGAFLSNSGTAYLTGTWTGWTAKGISVEYGGRAFAGGNFRSGATDAATDISVTTGGIISIGSSTVGGISQRANIMTQNGIILDSRVGGVALATEAAPGFVELATAAEATAGTDTARAITPATSGSRTTFATTSTDDATSSTAAPLKSAGGLAVAKTIYLGGPVKTAGKSTIATRWVGEIPTATTTAVTILSRSATNGARPAVLTIYTSSGLGNDCVCGVAKYLLYPSASHALMEQYGVAGAVGGYGSVTLAWDGNDLKATKENNNVGCCLELETFNNTTYQWVSPNSTYFSIGG